MVTAVSGSDLDLNGLKTPQPSTARGNSELGQDAFLQLMITQFRNQDPTKPLEPNDFLAQLAQFTNVSSLADVSKSVAKLSEALYANQALQASSLIGRSVLVDGNTGVLAPGQPMGGAVELPVSTSTGVVRIYNPAGEMVRQVPLGPAEAGLNRFAWDGLTAAGEPAAPGRYRFDAIYRNGDGEQSIGTYASTKVTSITLGQDLAGSTITTETGQELRLAQVKAIN
jgi:flagellar basal-body rod modification protein FlgD